MISVDTIASEVLGRAGTDLFGLVADRVYFGAAPSSFKNGEAAIVFRPEEGEGALFGSPVQSRSYLIECWGGDASANSWAGADLVYRAVHDAWHDAGKVTVSAGVMMQGWEEQAGVPLVHPDTKHKYYVCRVGGKFRGA